MPKLVRFFAVLLVSLVVAGCVSTRVNSAKVNDLSSSVESLLLHVRDGQFKDTNSAATLGQRNLESLRHSLESKLPSVFQSSGTQMRVIDRQAPELQGLSRLGPNEYLLVITPKSATYSSQSGQSLTVAADVVDPRTKKVVWHADIRLATLGFGKFDEALATDLGIQLIEKLRNDSVLTRR